MTRGSGNAAIQYDLTISRTELEKMRTEEGIVSIQMLGTVNVHQPTIASSNWSSGDYAYDGAGNITQIGNDRYLYDSVNRLVSGSVQGTVNTQTYTYDAFGNRLTATRRLGSVSCVGSAACESNPSISSATNRLSTSAGTYDAAGNLISLGSYSYLYDVTNTVRNASDGVTKHEFVYTADGERLATYSHPANNSSGSWTWTIRDVDSRILREYTSGGSSGSASWVWLRDYVWRTNDLLATETRNPATGSTVRLHFHLDHLGTPRLVTNAAGQRVAAHDFYAFGTEIANSSVENPEELLKFTGHERDPLVSDVNGITYIHARYYSTGMGRFLSLDPNLDIREASREPQLWNRYAYVTNSPLRYIDDNGRERLQAYHFPRELGGLPPESNADVARETLKMGVMAGATLLGPELLMAAATACIGNLVACSQAIGGALAPGPGAEIPVPEAIIPGAVNSQWGKLDYLLGEVKSGTQAADAWRSPPRTSCC